LERKPISSEPHFVVAVISTGPHFDLVDRMNRSHLQKYMTIKEFITSVARLVKERDIINHGSIRCLYSDQAARDIESVEDCDEVDTDTIGDDELSQKLTDIVDEDREGSLDFDLLQKLEYKYRGGSVDDYIVGDKEGELENLDKLIEAARELI